MMLAVDNSRILSRAGLCLLVLTERTEKMRLLDIGGGTCSVGNPLFFVVEDFTDFPNRLAFFCKLNKA
jgi:hypothetical protein